MTHRTNWKVLCTTDPIPGDSSEIRDAAQKYSKIATDIESSEDALSHIVTGQIDSAWESLAVDVIRDAANSVISMLQKAQLRYTVAAAALDDYASALDTAQTRADDDEGRAQLAAQARENAENVLKQSNATLANLKAAQQQMDNYSGDPSGAPTDSQILDNSHSITSCNNAIANANTDIANANNVIADALADLQQAVKNIHDAADTAADKIIAEMDSDGLNEKWWEKALYVLDDIMRLAADLAASIVTDVINMVTSAINDIIDGLIDMAKALADTLKGLAEGILTGDWSGLETGLVELLSAVSEFMDGVSSIVGIISIFVPQLKVVAAGLTIISAGLDMATQMVTNSFTPANMASDVLKIGSAFLPDASKSMESAAGTASQSLADTVADHTVDMVAHGQEDFWTNTDNYLQPDAWPSPAQDLISDIASPDGVAAYENFINRPTIGLQDGPSLPSTSLGQSVFQISPVTVSFDSYLVPSISGGITLFGDANKVTVSPVLVDINANASAASW